MTSDSRGKGMALDRNKLKWLVHYVVANASDPAKLGSTKLHKILWFSDARAFVLHGQPITGETYVRQKHGPIAQHFLPTRDALMNEGAIRVIRQPVFNHDQDVYISLRAPDQSPLKRGEKQIVDYFLHYVVDEHTATSISEESHDYGWEIAKMGEALPYHAILASRARDPQGAELEWARNVARSRRLP